MVAITGMGVVSANGVGVTEFHEAQLAGTSGVGAIARYDCSADAVRIAGEVELPTELRMSRRDQVRSDRCTELAAAAARLAMEHSGVRPEDERARTGVAIGSAIGGAATWETNYLAYASGGPRALRSRVIPMAMANDAASWITIRYGFTGPCVAPSVACASGAEALIAGAQMIMSGEADIVFAGGAEAPVVRGVVSGFNKLGALSLRSSEPEQASRPFSKDRDGFVVAEGAAVLVLESAAHADARGARKHAYLRGFGRSADAHHVTMPDPDGRGAESAIRQALRSAEAVPSDVDMINAHGTSTVLNDMAEARALRNALGTETDSVAVTATKSMIGHSLGAAGAIEAVATVQAVASGRIPPTRNLDDPDPEIDLDVVCSTAKQRSITLALSNSFAFGGHNVVLAFAPAESEK